MSYSEVRRKVLDAMVQFLDQLPSVDMFSACSQDDCFVMHCCVRQAVARKWVNAASR